MGFDELTAAQWVCESDNKGDVPAVLVADGRSAEVLALIRRTMYEC
ncbi:hypothetical protein [Marilutibacter maris]|nr:hypothetical protein [Lysobacter maris]